MLTEGYSSFQHESSKTSVEAFLSYEQVEKKVARLPDGPLKIKLINALEESGDDDEVLRQVYEKAESILVKKRELQKQKFVGDYGVNVERIYASQESETIKKIRATIERIRTSDGYLGEGASAEVYFSVDDPERCYKIITNEIEYSKVNSVNVESDYLSELADLEVEGVRTPKPYYAAMHSEFHVLVMEKVNGPSLEQIFNGEVALPKNFDYNDFFRSLRMYITAMHERDIYHRDLHSRNVMLDFETGKPRVIDMGKAAKAFFSEDDPYLVQRPGYPSERCLDDDAQVAVLREKMLEYLKTFNVVKK